jgi:hypothetical protein
VTLFCSGGVPGTHSKGVGYKGAIRRWRWSARRGSSCQWLALEVFAASHEEDDGEGQLKSQGVRVEAALTGEKENSDVLV